MTSTITTSRCPYCLQTKPCTTLDTPSRRGVQEHALDAEIERIEKLMESLLLERSKLYKKRNEMRAPIYSLPQEILTLIFEFACPPLDFSQMYGLDSPVDGKAPHPGILGVLAAVSARWHDIVLSTPSLWASFVADDNDINAMPTIFSRSGNLPVASCLKFPVESEWGKPHTAFLDPVLQGHASRIRMLRVRNAPPTWLKKHIPSFVGLQFLCLEAVRRDGDEEVVIPNPCTHLVLKETSHPISLCWSNIQVLHLNNVPVYDCLEMLRKCTRLREYRLRDPDDSILETGPLPSSPFILPCLELFEWMVEVAEPVDRAMLENVRMPALRTLVWDEDCVSLSSSDFLSTFFEHLPSTLSVIHVQNSALHMDFSIFSHILNLSNVEHLIFKECATPFLDDAFSSLGSEKRLIGNQELPVLPKLKSIYIACPWSTTDPENVLQALQRGPSQPPEPTQQSPLRLEIAPQDLDWEPNFREELIRMVEKGRKVELWEDSKPVGWLPDSR